MNSEKKAKKGVPVATNAKETSSVKIVEKDATGHITKTYVMTMINPTSNPQIRLDLIPSTITTTSVSTHSSNNNKPNLIIPDPWVLSKYSPHNFLTTVILPIFLPHGYPHTVTDDYTPYQIYDSLQAFASTIAGLLSSRAVLQSFGFDDTESSSSSSTTTATYATLLSIVQATISNLSTILFANYASSRIAPEVKFYRFLADIVNDAAFVLDCLSPLLVPSLRVPVLCLSSAFRAVCGVAGGSSKAVLSAHFAKDGNIGELNAKDGSQETVINLIGMWVGGVVVSRVDGVRATWLWLLTLLGLHLWWNYSAVWHVRLKVLNRTRADIVMRELVEKRVCPNVDDVNKKEGVFGWRSFSPTRDQGKVWSVSFAPDFASFAQALRVDPRVGSGTLVGPSNVLPKLFSLFENERYLLWFDRKAHHVILMMKENVTAADQLKAWCHAVRVSLSKDSIDIEKTQDIALLSHVQKTLRLNSELWENNQSAVANAGWSTSICMLEIIPGQRLCLNKAE